MILSDYLNGVVDNRGRNPDRYFEKEKYPVIDNFLIKNELHPNILQASRYIDEQTYQNFLRGYVYPNMVIMTLVGNGIGNVTTISDPNSVIIQNTIGFDVKKDLLSDLFLFYFFYHKLDTIKQFDRGSGQPSIKKTDILNMEVDFPPLEIQKKIAGVLGALDDKIELNNKINNNLEQQAQALFKSWFVDFEPFGGVMPEDWKIGKLKDVLKLKKTPIRAGENCALPYLPIDIIPIHSLALTEFRPNSEAQSSLITFDKDDILIGAMRVYFHRVTIAPCAGITRTTCFVLSPFDESYLLYALLLCNQDKSIEFAQTSSKGSTMPYAVWNGGLGDLEINIPQRNIVEKFNNILLPSIRQIQNSYFENTRLAAIRDTLLPKLMSGEIDVSNVDISALTSTDKLSFRCLSPPKKISYCFSSYFYSDSVICDFFIRQIVEFSFGNLWCFHLAICGVCGRKISGDQASDQPEVTSDQPKFFTIAQKPYGIRVSAKR